MGWSVSFIHFYNSRAWPKKKKKKYFFVYYANEWRVNNEGETNGIYEFDVDPVDEKFSNCKFWDYL